MAGKKDKSDLSRLPKVDIVLQEKVLDVWKGSTLATAAVREVLEMVRKDAAAHLPTMVDPAEVASRAANLLQDRFAPQLRRVINGTGIIIHTNLGRSPLSEAAIQAVEQAARSYSTLEYDLDKGRRGSRHFLVREMLLALTGAEDALVANNNASALLLALTALSKRKQVIVSRGELVEIGGSFRIPDICRLSGAKMVEVGTTNRTRIADYRKEVSDKTGLLLRVHPSNFRVVGFTEGVTMPELVKLGEESGVPVVNDLGSGALVDVSKLSGLPREPLVSEAVAEGASVVTFSGDKLLGGPQAGIAVGRKEVIEKMRRHPLMRVVRPDKLSFAALDATLRAYLRPASLADELPVWTMLHARPETLDEWARPLVSKLEKKATKTGLTIGLGDSQATSGGGSLPDETLPSLAIRFEGPARALNSLQKRLRLGEPSVIGYLKDGTFFLDIRTMIIEDRDEICDALTRALLKT
ncbi:L-seryl-tRNA(Sec) selenium transferase [bacterium]|nr:L-seryl-tRNA(Sec) selenium transferase [bacterium]